MSWNNELDNIYNFAALHSWCTQTNQMIDEFIIKFRSESQIITYLCNKVKEKNLPLEYYIISLVLLHYMEYPTYNIIELTDTCLYDKIDRNDLLFFRDHLFSGRFPLPEGLTYDITNRSFLSAKRAIKKAMEIDSVISKENPELTVLYMTFILSRVDMNEQNRAMVAFLLLKVDVDLPDRLKERIFKYLRGLKEIMKELLDEENSTLESTDKLQEEIDKLNLNNPEKNERKTDQKVYQAYENQQLVTDKERKAYLQKSNVSILEAILESSEDKGKLKDIEASITKIPLEIADTSKKGIDNSKNISENYYSKEKTNVKSETQEKSNKNSISVIIEKQETNKIEDIPKAFADVIDNSVELNNEKSKISEKFDDKKSKSWKIALKRNRDILESILFSFKKNTKNIRNKKNIKKTEKTEKSNKFIEAKVRNIKVALSLMLLLVLSLPIFFLLKNFEGNEPAISEHLSPDVSESRRMDSFTVEEDVIGKEIDVNEEVTALAGSATDTEMSEPDSTDKLIPSDFPVDFTIVDKKIHWKVSEGESISGVYYILQDLKPQLEGTVLEGISKMTWEELFSAFISNNPARDSYHIIYPSETFILPLK